MMGADQLAQFVGPALAGTVIALFGTAHVDDRTGRRPDRRRRRLRPRRALVRRVGRDARAHERPAGARRPRPATIRCKAIGEGLRYTISQPVFRWMLALLAAANFLLIGPLMVGIPVLAQTRFTQGAAAFGLLISAYGLGNLGGMIVAGSTGRPSSGLFSWLVLGLFAGFGVVIGALAFISSVWVGVALLAVLGVGNGYIAVVLMTLLQRITPGRDARQGDESRHSRHARRHTDLDRPRRRHHRPRRRPRSSSAAVSACWSSPSWRQRAGTPGRSPGWSKGDCRRRKGHETISVNSARRGRRSEAAGRRLAALLDGTRPRQMNAASFAHARVVALWLSMST